MSLITKVKAGSVTSLSDARYFSGMGAEWLGFDVNPNSENFVSLEQYKNIAGWITGPARVIELPTGLTNEAIQQILGDYLPDFVQVELTELNSILVDKPILATARLSSLDWDALRSASGKIEYLILDAGSDYRSKIPAIQEACSCTNVLLVVDASDKEIKQLVTTLPLAGIALKSSSKELKPGIKEYDYSDLLESLDDEV